MTIEEVIDWLRNEAPEDRTNFGWYQGDSYRGYYDCFAVEPADRETTIGEMISVLEDAIGQTFEGYKGGEFTMYEDTPVFYAHYGSGGPAITKGFLKAMFKDPDFNYMDFKE